MIYLPDYPETTWWLTQSERQLAVARGREGELTPLTLQPTTQQVMQTPKISFSLFSLLETLKEPRLWFLTIIFSLVWTVFDAASFLSPQVAITSFDILPSELRANSSAIHKLILDRENASFYTVLMSAVPFFVGGILSIPVSSHSDLTAERLLHATVPLIFSLGGFIFLMIVPPSFAGGGSARYFTGILPAVSGLLISLPSLIAYAIDSLAGDTSRCASTFLLTAFGLSWGQMIILSNDLFPISEEPAYIKGLLALSGLLVVSIIGLFIIYYHSSSENSKWGKSPGYLFLISS